MATNSAASDAATQRIEAALSQIQPIRDLARNWDVDIASCLEDYLEEIVGHFADETQEDAANTSSNAGWPQAALLVQNSSNVYSRKVEYLYSLVYAALDDLVSSTGQQKKQRSRTTDADIDEFDSYDPQVQFLLLDDVLPTDNTHAGEKINLMDDDADEYGNQDPLGFGGGRASLLSRNSFAPGTGRSTLLGGADTTMDRSLGGTSAAQRALMGTLHPQGSDTAGGNLRLLNGRCDMNPEGVLVMPGTSQFGGRSSSLDGGGNEGVPVVSTTAAAAQDDQFYDDDDDGGGFQMMDDGDDEPMHHQSATEPSHTEASRATTAPRAAKKPAPSKNDPWSLLDPHDPGTSKARPLRIGVTYRLPEGFGEPPSKFVTGAHTRHKPPTRTSVERAAHHKASSICIATETFKATMANEKRRRQTRVSHADDSSVMSVDETNDMSYVDNIVRPRVPLKGLIFGDEFAYIAKAAAKRKAMERRERRKLLSQDPQAVAPQEADQLLGFGDQDDEDDGGFVAFDDGDDGSMGGGPFDGDDQAEGGPVVGNTGFASLEDAFRSHDDDDRDTSNVQALEFEALCRAHIRAFARGAEKYAAETNLTKRVGDWQNKLAPILEEEDQRPEFDIHRYSDHVVQLLKSQVAGKGKGSSSNKSLDFQSVTRKSEQYEVCRLFLASLSLSNSGNVAFSAEEGCVATPDSLRLELLDEDIDRPMEKYLAPSAHALVQ